MSPTSFDEASLEKLEGTSAIGHARYSTSGENNDYNIASNHSIEEIKEYINADSVGYLSVDGLLKAVEEDRDRYCSACFSGNYPIELPTQGRDQLKLFEKVRD